MLVYQRVSTLQWVKHRWLEVAISGKLPERIQ